MAKNDPTYKLCNSVMKDVEHFIASCATLQEERERLFSEALPNIQDLSAVKASHRLLCARPTKSQLVVM